MLLSISGESDKSSEELPISGPLVIINSCNIKVSFSAIHFLVFGLAFNCSFILYST